MEICDIFSFVFLLYVRGFDDKMYLHLVYVIIDKLTLLPMENEIKIIIITELTYYELPFSTQKWQIIPKN